jgi:hypothetical protein
MKMATIKLGGIASDIRGSIGGVVYSRNGGGAYAKQRVKPTNPNTSGQQIARSIISSMFAAWSLLTALVRTGWATYAKNVTLPNRLGDPINLSGYNMYTRTRAITELLGIAMPANAPTTYSLAEQDSTLAVVADGAADTLSITFDNLLGWANEVGGKLLIYQGVPQNPTVNSYDGPFRYAGCISGAVSAPTAPQVISSVYNITEGQRCFVQARILRADGRLSTPFKTECLVTGTPLVAPAAVGTYSGGVLTTVLTFPQSMNVGSLPAAADFRYTGGACVNMAHTTAVWTNATHLTLTVTTANSPVGTGSLVFTPGVIPLLTQSGKIYEGFTKEEVVSGS